MDTKHDMHCRPRRQNGFSLIEAMVLVAVTAVIATAAVPGLVAFIDGRRLDAAIERIQDKLLNGGGKEVLSAKLGEHVMRELKRIDKVAYVRFASVYRSFEDVDEFRQLIRDI